MPQVYIKSLPNNYLVGLHHITESLEDIKESLFLQPTESAIFQTYTHHEKRLEWCAARRLVQCMAEYLGFPYQGIRKDDNGKPWLINSSVELSISHSFPYVCAIMHPGKPVGIDLEQPKHKLLKIGPRFLNDRELFIAGNDIERLCVLWCAKEALYKIYSKRGVNFRNNLSLTPTGEYPWNQINGSILIANPLYYSLNVSYGENYVMVHNV